MSLGFLQLLSEKEKRVLRKSVRLVHMKHYPKHLLTDHEADKIIEVIGRESVETLLKAGINNKIDDV